MQIVEKGAENREIQYNQQFLIDLPTTMDAMLPWNTFLERIF